MLRKGNVFTSVCQEFCPHGGRCTPPGRHTPLDTPHGRSPRQTLPWTHTHLLDTPLPTTTTAADGTHPTGMQSCLKCNCVSEQLPPLDHTQQFHLPFNQIQLPTGPTGGSRIFQIGYQPQRATYYSGLS